MNGLNYTNFFNELNKEHLKKYTALYYMKKNYENHKAKEIVKEYKEETNYVVPKKVIKDFTIKYFAN